MRCKLLGLLTGLCLIGCAAIALPATAPPMDVRIVSAPDSGSDVNLSLATWVLAIITAMLCWITRRSANDVLKDASRLRQEVQEREVNTAAHRAAANAEHVGQLAARVPTSAKRLLAISSPAAAMPASDPTIGAANQRVARTDEIKENALNMIGRQAGTMAVAELANAQRRLDEHLVQLEVLKESINGELESLARQIDGAEREALDREAQRRASQQRISSEVGQCNKLIFVLGQMVNSLEDMQETIFLDPARKLGRKPQWHEIGALVGGPAEGPEFILGEYVFLLDDEDPTRQVPSILSRLYTTEFNFKQTQAQLNERSRLWHEFNDMRATKQFQRGEEALTASGPIWHMQARLKELTEWIEADFEEWIPKIKALLTDLTRVLVGRYPQRRFIVFHPN